MTDLGDYRPRIQRALAFIAENIDRSLTLAEVAKVAHTSEFHFHRVFTAVMGEPVGQFITRQRLETGALMLAYHREKSVTDVAFACGYSSTANFSKAFSAYFGCRPGDVRRPSSAKEAANKSKVGKLLRKHGKEFAPSDLYALPTQGDDEENERRYTALDASARCEDMPEIGVACMASPRGYDPAVVQKTWDELIARARQLGLAGDAIDAYAIAHDSPILTAPSLCRYHACVPVLADAKVAKPLFRDVIPAGRYALFRHRGPVAAIEETYTAIYSLWFPRSSLIPGDFRPIEHYDHDAPVGGWVDMEIRIRVRPRPR